MDPEKPHVFWGEIAPCDHLLQIYENDPEFLSALTGFVTAGFRKNESVIIIATAWHITALEKRLADFDLNALRAGGQYIALDAEETLAQFMVEGWPDSLRFERCIIEILKRASRGSRRVRAFGEMVALLWARNQQNATFQLEYLWHQLQRKQAFSLFCAYPKRGFSEKSSAAVEKICQAHSKVVPPSLVAQ